MSFEVAYRFHQTEVRSPLGDLDRVALTAAATSDDGDVLPVGAEGTVVSTYRDGSAYVVEFAAPPGALATVEAGNLRLVERIAV